MLSRRCTPSLLVALLLLAAPAAAEVSDADRATARMLAQQGQEALDAGDWATAAERFARADALVHAPTLLLALARAEVGQGRWLEALEHLHRIAREGVAPGAPLPWTRALQDAQKELTALEPRLPAAVIQLRGAGAPTARVTIDGVPVPAAALGINRPVDPGKRTLRAEAEGFVPVEVVVTFVEGTATPVPLVIDLPQPAPHAAPPPPPPAGRRSLAPIGFAGIGVGGAALLLGAVTGALALSKHGALASTCPGGHCTGQQSAIDSYDLMGTLSTAGFVAGGILAATGVVLVALPRSDPPPGEARVTPLVGPGFVGMRGSF
jgi:hypothetical protein